METFGTRFKKAREAAGYSQRSLGAKIGVSGTAIGYWEDGTTDPSNIRNAALQTAAGLLKTTVNYLLTGKDRRESGDAPPGMRLADADVRTVPLISHVQAGYGVGAADPYERGDGSQEVGVDGELAAKLGRLAFALEIEGESMMDEFRPGDIVIIDPNVKPVPGDYVVARINDNEATFKKYRPRGTDVDGSQIFELVPLNEDYEIIRVSSENPGVIIGTMMEHRRRRRRQRMSSGSDELVSGWQWIGVLDGRSRPECRIRDGKRYALTKQPVGHLIPWLGGPGKLVSKCRCLALPIMKTWRELGIAVDDMPIGTRASIFGQVPMDLYWPQWIVMQTAEFTTRVLGHDRARLLLEIGLAYEELHDQYGNYLSIMELREIHPQAF